MPTNEEPHARCEGAFHSSILLPFVLLCCNSFYDPKSITTIEAPRSHDRGAQMKEIDRVRKMGTFTLNDSRGGQLEQTTADEKTLVNSHRMFMF